MGKYYDLSVPKKPPFWVTVFTQVKVQNQNEMDEAKVEEIRKAYHQVDFYCVKCSTKEVASYRKSKTEKTRGPWDSKKDFFI